MVQKTSEKSQVDDEISYFIDYKYGNSILWEKSIQVVAAEYLNNGDHIIDVGTNTGGLAIAFSRLVGEKGKVLCFECNPKMINWIKRSFKVNNVTNTILIEKACYNKCDEKLSFYADNSLYSAGSSLNNRPGLVGDKITVITTTIDREVEEKNISPRIIKIDVEGAEYSVLQGAESTINKFYPMIIFEYYDFKENEHNPASLLESYGYKLYDVNTLEPFKHENSKKLINLFAIQKRQSYITLDYKNKQLTSVNQGEIIIKNVKKGKYVIKPMFITNGESHDSQFTIKLSYSDVIEELFWQVICESKLIIQDQTSTMPINLKVNTDIKIEVIGSVSQNYACTIKFKEILLIPYKCIYRLNKNLCNLLLIASILMLIILFFGNMF